MARPSVNSPDVTQAELRRGSNRQSAQDDPEPGRAIASEGKGRAFNWWYTDEPAMKGLKSVMKKVK